MDNTSLEVWGVVGNWFSGVMTLAVVFLALGLQVWYERKKRPKLVMLYDHNNNDDNRYVKLNISEQPVAEHEADEPKIEELWLRVNIENVSKVTALGVQVRFMYCIREGNKDKDDRPSWWFKVANLDSISIPVPQKFMQPFDIAFIKNEAGKDKDIDLFLAIVNPNLKEWKEQKKIIETKKYNKLAVGEKYTIVFAVIGDNVEATYYKMDITAARRAENDVPQVNLLGPDTLKHRLIVTEPVVIESPRIYIGT